MCAVAGESYEHVFGQAIDVIIKDVEERIKRPMTESQKEGLRQAGTLMFLEAMSMGFYCAQDDAAVEKWLQEIDGFHRQ